MSTFIFKIIETLVDFHFQNFATLSTFIQKMKKTESVFYQKIVGVGEIYRSKRKKVLKNVNLFEPYFFTF